MGQGTELFGRGPDTDRLHALVANERSVLVLGDAGVGKSALVHTTLAPTRVVVVLRGVGALSSIPYVPLRAAWPALRADASPAVIAERVCDLIPTQGVVVVEDLHWCDADTQAVVAELVMRRTIVATARRAPPVPALDGLLGEVVAVVDLNPLDDQSAALLVRSFRPAAPDADVAKCVRSAHGNPFELQLLAQAGPREIDAQDLAPAAVVDLRTDALEQLAELALRGVAVDASMIPPQVLTVLDARCLVTIETDGTCRPRHDLLGAAAIAAISDDQRRSLHRRLAGESDDAAVRAVHLVAAGDHARAAEAAALAAAVAPTVWSRAEFLRIVADGVDPPSPVASHAAADALSLAGRYQEALEVLGPWTEDTAEGPAATLIRVRSWWATTDIDHARAGIDAALRAPDLDGSIASELLSLRSRIRCRVDWDLDGGIADGRRAVELAEDANHGRVAAHSALGLAYLMAGDASWQVELAEAGRLAIADEDVHNAVTEFDTAFFGHLLSGDPSRCAPIAAQMIELTESTSTAWNGYFRAVALLARVLVAGDHRGVLREAQHLEARVLTVKSRESLRTATSLALIDDGHDLDAITHAEEALERASDASARAQALWALAEACWAAGEMERAVVVADATFDLGLAGFPGVVNSVLIAQWARRELGWPIDERATAAVQSGFTNLAAAAVELEGLLAPDPRDACAAFERAAQAWAKLSVRSSLRTTWAAAEAAWEAGQPERADVLFRAAEAGATRYGIVWLDRRVEAGLRQLGRPRVSRSTLRRPPSAEVLARVARGQASTSIARALRIKPSTVETHVRRAMARTGARTRLQAAAFAESAITPETRPHLQVVRRADGSRVLRSDDAREDAPIVELGSILTLPWTLTPDRVVAGTIVEDDDLALGVLAVLRGAPVVLVVPPGAPAVTTALLDALARIGAVVATDEPTGIVLHPEDRHLLRLLADGSTISDAAAAMHWSRRTIQRRLASVRSALGASTTAEAVMIAVATEPAGREEPPTLGTGRAGDRHGSSASI